MKTTSMGTRVDQPVCALCQQEFKANHDCVGIKKDEAYFDSHGVEMQPSSCLVYVSIDTTPTTRLVLPEEGDK